ncbi:MAG TPA: PilZ domain-containing protein [Sphingobium sp.]|nr:PilZ domain-containing protein [Sphingobium sp.]
MPSTLASLAHVAQSRDPAGNQRRAPRILVDMVSHIVSHGRTYGVRIINISALGLMCRTDAQVMIGERIFIWLPVIKDVQAEVRWAEDSRIGVEFRAPIEPGVYDEMLRLIPRRQTAW